ncbi:hypothetical protein [Sphingobacterium faecale]|uniref:Beta-carotene 15,15'-monooxygenase n=1 Tax=Sphingobacterium faecale TaxID=2803775 RepID=A0ABS1R1H3_9SPHI|nr:hypothetical protein [Sphingobacterium faecale]MBL1408545.1 hypothetical protein [Sphingobacterium faecale]
MLAFLKESTFKANDVLFRAFNILKKHYVSVAGLCFVIFLVSQLIAFSASYFDYLELWFRVVLMLLSIVLFFGLQLVLIKRAILLSQGIEHANLMQYVPSTKQFVNFLFGLILCSLLGSILTLLIGVLFFPLVFMHVDKDFITYEVVPFLSAIVGGALLIRITFFPFFILERNVNFFRGVKLSLAFTRGNFFRVLTVFFLLGLSSLIAYFLLKIGYWYIAVFFMGISTFLFIPLVSLAMAVIYTDMMKEYKGSDDPELFKSII